MENYFLIATISSIVFYAGYYFFLRKESFHSFNRFYLLGAVAVSLLIPFVRFSVPPLAGMLSTSSNPVTVSEFIAYIQLPEFTVSATDASWWSFANLFWGIYLSGVAIFSILFIVKLVKISLLIFQSKKNRKGKYVFVEYDENMAPFSFFNYIFINTAAYNQEDHERIVLHEQIHVQKRHSWDLIFMELAGILLWFNPVIVLYKRSLQIIHEYMADHCVLQQGIETGAYLNLLLRQLVLPNEWMIGHHFNYLLTKNRFKMLKNHHYSRWALAKTIYVAPLIAFLLLLNCKHNTPENQISEEITCEKLELPEGAVVGDFPEDAVFSWIDETDNANVEEANANNEAPFRFAEVMPEPIGGFDAMYEFLKSNLKYPAEAREKGIQGQVLIEYVIEKDGTVSNVKVLQGVDPLLDWEAVRAVKLMPKWKPGQQDGKPVRCFYQMPVRFTIN